MRASNAHPTDSSHPFDVLQGVSRTLLIPLYARAFGKTLLPSLGFEDVYARELIAPLSYSIREVSRDLFPMRLCLARTYYLDQLLSQLLEGNPGRTVLLLACGLDTMPLRLSALKARWICGDLEPVMDLREQLLPAGERTNHLAIELPKDLPTLKPLLEEGPPVVVLEGILPYLKPKDVVECFQLLRESCPQGADILVDSYHPTLLSFAEMGATFKRMKTQFQFGLEHPQIYETYSSDLSYVEHWSLLHLMPWYMRKRCWLPQLVARKKPMATMCHLRFMPLAGMT